MDGDENSIGVGEAGEAGEAEELADLHRTLQMKYVSETLGFLHDQLETVTMSNEKATQVLRAIERLEHIKKKLTGRKIIEIKLASRD